MVTELRDSERTKAWRDELQRKLKQSAEDAAHDILVGNQDVSLAFPGELSVHDRDLRQIDWNSFVPWALALGWEVAIAPEATHPEDVHFPEIRCIRRRSTRT